MSIFEAFIQPSDAAGEDEVDRNRQGDLLNRFLNKSTGISGFEGKKVSEAFADEKSRRDLINNLSFEQFKEMLNGLNGIMRDKPKDQWKPDGQDVVLESPMFGTDYVPPKFEDKEDLIRELFTAMQQMNQKGESLENIGFMAGLTLNAIHPYNDGNGRTGRAIFELLTKGYQKENIPRVISDEGRNQINLTPSAIKRFVEGVISIRENVSNRRVLETHEFDDEQIPQTKKELNRMVQDDYVMFSLAIFDFYQKNSLEIKSNQYGRPTIDLGGVDNLSDDQIEQIQNSYWSLKKKYVETLIDSFVNEKKPEYYIEQYSKTIKDYAISGIKEIALRREKERGEEQARAKAFLDEQERIWLKQLEIAGRFEKGEGEKISYTKEEIEALRNLTNKLTSIDLAKSKIKEDIEQTDAEKLEIARGLFLELAKKIGCEDPDAQELIGEWLSKTENETFLSNLSEYESALSAISEIENSGIFNKKFTTSKDLEVPFENDLKSMSDYMRNLFFKDLFTQSLYFKNDKGNTLRILLYACVNPTSADLIQSINERVGFSSRLIKWQNKAVVKIEQLEPETRKYIYETAGQSFIDEVYSPDINPTDQFTSEVKMIKDDEGIYFEKPDNCIVHSGYSVVKVMNIS